MHGCNPLEAILIFMYVRILKCTEIALAIEHGTAILLLCIVAILNRNLRFETTFVSQHLFITEMYKLDDSSKF